MLLAGYLSAEPRSRAEVEARLAEGEEQQCGPRMKPLRFQAGPEIPAVQEPNHQREEEVEAQHLRTQAALAPALSDLHLRLTR